jgi:hypothetical protein
MSFIVYGGVKYTQVRHAIYCNTCLETIESTHIHDFKMCSCGAVGIDGGLSDGNRILGDPSDIQIRSMYCAMVDKKSIWLPLFVIEEYYQNNKLVIRVP